MLPNIRFAKIVALVQVILIGSLFSLGVGIYCDFFMKHEKGGSPVVMGSSCHSHEKSADTDTDESDPSDCPVWSSLESPIGSMVQGFPLSLLNIGISAETLISDSSPLHPDYSLWQLKEVQIPPKIPVYLKIPRLRI